MFSIIPLQDLLFAVILLNKIFYDIIVSLLLLIHQVILAIYTTLSSKYKKNPVDTGFSILNI